MLRTENGTKTSADPLEIKWLGRIGFAEALALQEEWRAEIQAGARPDTFLLLEHEHVYTIGRTRDRSSLHDPAQLPHPVHEINRGGQATWHGPGQLVGYALLDLNKRGRDLHVHLRNLEEILIQFLRRMGINGTRREGLTGVWIDNRKIASIGVGVRHWITMHGFALNVSRDLSAFDHITPCGIQDVTVTSIERETCGTLTVEQAAAQIEPAIRSVLS